jgi:hypothetical protein
VPQSFGVFLQFSENVQLVGPAEVDVLLLVAGQVLRGISPEIIPRAGRSVSRWTLERLGLGVNLHA